MKDSSKIKNAIREKIWELLEEKDIAAFPRPVKGRIPNFKGAERAANLLCNSSEYKRASVDKVNPDSPQRIVRLNCLKDGKILIMPTPRIREGFLVLYPDKIPRRDLSKAATIAGAFKFGEKIHPSKLPDIDLIVIGSVAVTREGDRIGKGEGYAEIEYAILRAFGKVSEDTPIQTTVHRFQIVDYIPREPFDVTVDTIFTPEERMDTTGDRNRPKGIIWSLISRDKVEEIPILRELMEVEFGEEHRGV